MSGDSFFAQGMGMVKIKHGAMKERCDFAGKTLSREIEKIIQESR